MRIAILIAPWVSIHWLLLCQGLGIATSRSTGTNKRINKLANGRALMNRPIPDRKWNDVVRRKKFRAGTRRFADPPAGQLLANYGDLTVSFLSVSGGS